MAETSVGMHIASQFPLSHVDQAKLSRLIDQIDYNRHNASNAADISLRRALDAEEIAAGRLAAIGALAQYILIELQAELKKETKNAQT